MQKDTTMRVLYIFIFTMLLTATAFSQVTDKETDLRKANADSVDGWKKGGMFNLTFSQVSLTNWAAGGENSYSGNVLINLFSKYKKKKFSWENYLDFGYGILKQGESGIRKSDDKIDISSKAGYKLKNNSFLAGLMNFKTQAMPGYNYPDDSTVISDFMSPGYLLFAAGYDHKVKDKYSFFFAPVTGKATFVSRQVLADAGAFGVEPAVLDTDGSIIKHGKRSRLEFGGYLKSTLTLKLMENVNLSTKLELFSNYLKKPQNIDVYWETLLSMKINKYLAVTINTTLIYDDDVVITVKDKSGNVTGKGPRTQFKEVFGMGFSYKF